MTHHGHGWPLSRFGGVMMALVLAWAVAGWTEGPPGGKTKVFLLAGQSNMDGRADGNRLSAEEQARLAEISPRVLLAYNHGPARPLGLTEPSTDVAKEYGITQAFGPELFFGITLAEAWPQQRIVLIKRSKGGSSLYGRWHPDWNVERARVMEEGDKPALYPDFMSYVKRVLSDYPADAYEISAVLWVQGEQDSGISRYGPRPAEAYGANLGQLIRALRNDTGVENLPFIMLQVGSGKVVEGMKQVADTVPNVTLITPSTDPNSPDFLPVHAPPLGHYDYEGMKRIGRKFAEVYLRDYVPAAAPSNPGL